MAKADRLYFENLVASADYACKAAEYLVHCLNNYKYEDLRLMMVTMHEHENAGDTKKHEMSAALARAFVTPVDREDLALISQNIDDVTDSIEEVLQAFYMYRIQTVVPEAIDFAHRITECCTLMKDMLVEFVNFKKPQKLHELIVELSHREEVCDWVVLPVTSFDMYYSGSYFSKRILSTIPEKILERQNHMGTCRYRVAEGFRL